MVSVLSSVNAEGSQIIRVIVAGLAMAFCAVANAQNQKDDPLKDATGKYAGAYLCIAEAAGGVGYDPQSNRWVGSGFRADAKHIVKIKNDGYAYNKDSQRAVAYSVQVAQMGEIPSKCFKWSSLGLRPVTVTKEGMLTCRNLFTDWIINLGNGRYRTSDRYRYVDGRDNDSSTPYIEVGKCSRID